MKLPLHKYQSKKIFKQLKSYDKFSASSITPTNAPSVSLGEAPTIAPTNAPGLVLSITPSAAVSHHLLRYHNHQQMHRIFHQVLLLRIIIVVI